MYIYYNPEEIYKEDKAIEIMKRAIEIVADDETISLDGEVGLKLSQEGLCSIATIDYLKKKFNTSKLFQSLNNDLNKLLEARKCKDKSMYPGIAAMALKNKHKWRDQHDFTGDMNHNVNFFESIVNRALPESVIANSNGDSPDS